MRRRRRLASGLVAVLPVDADGRGILLDDPESTNGTYVESARIGSATDGKFGDTITLGSRTVPMPWPPEVVWSVSIGRVPGNDITLDDPG